MAVIPWAVNRRGHGIGNKRAARRVSTWRCERPFRRRGEPAAWNLMPVGGRPPRDDTMSPALSSRAVTPADCSDDATLR